MNLVDPATLADVRRYPIDALDSSAGQDFLLQSRTALEKDSICVLDGFIQAEALEEMVQEAEALIAQGFYYNQPRSSYTGNDDQDDDWPEGHPRTIKHTNRYRQVLNYQIPNDSLIRRLFLWPELTEYVRRILGFDTLYTSACPHLALTLQIAHEGDCNGWHYDSNNGIVTLLLQKPDSGGAFEYVPDLRAENDERYDRVNDLFASPDTYARKPDVSAGALTLFNGKYAMHRVTTVGPTARPRIIAIFSYDKRPDKLFSQGYIDMVRSFKQDVATTG